LFSLLVLAIPTLQLWLAIQQNEIIAKQNQMFEIQVYDVVSRSMTEGDRNARVMTGALLARSDPGFLEGVVRESFDPTLSEVYRNEGVDAVQRRLEDAAYRGYLIRALNRAAALRAPTLSADELHEQLASPYALVASDAASRVPAIMRLGRAGTPIDDTLAEQIDNYLVHIGRLLATYGRVAHAADEEATYFTHIRPLVERLAQIRAEPDNTFALAYRTMLEDFLIDLALAPDVGDDARLGDARPEDAIREGMTLLRNGVGAEGVDWRTLEATVGGR
jgi:hypothetical protein